MTVLLFVFRLKNWYSFTGDKRCCSALVKSETYMKLQVRTEKMFFVCGFEIVTNELWNYSKMSDLKMTPTNSTKM